MAFHVAGHVLHSTFWTNLAPPSDQRPVGDLRAAIDVHFGSLAALQEQFTHIALSTRGSGWAALVWDPTITRLRPTQLRDHDVRSLRGARLLLVCDVREHATAEPAFRLLKAGLLLSGVVGAVALLGIQFATPDGSGLAQSPDDWVEAAGRGLA